MNNLIGPLGRLDNFKEQKYLHAERMQLILNQFRGWADTVCSSYVSLQTARLIVNPGNAIELMIVAHVRSRLLLSM